MHTYTYTRTDGRTKEKEEKKYTGEEVVSCEKMRIDTEGRKEKKIVTAVVQGRADVNVRAFSFSNVL